MALSDDPTALAAHLAEEARQRAISDRQRRQELAGDPQAKRDFDSRWEPLQAWLREHRDRED